LKKHWIPDQARNDENTNMSSSANRDKACSAGMTENRRKRLVKIATYYQEI